MGYKISGMKLSGFDVQVPAGLSDLLSTEEISGSVENNSLRDYESKVVKKENGKHVSHITRKAIFEKAIV